MSSEARTIRERLADAERRLDAARDRVAPLGGYQLYRVFAEATLPTAPERYYAGHPVAVSGPQAEGAVLTLTPDTGRTEYIAVFGRAPKVGDHLAAAIVGNRWVAGAGKGGCDSPIRVTVSVVACPPLGGGPFPVYKYGIDGAKVTIAQDDEDDQVALTSGAAGVDQFHPRVAATPVFLIPAAGTLRIKIEAAGYQTQNTTLEVVCGGGGDPAFKLLPVAGLGIDTAYVKTPLAGTLALTTALGSCNLTLAVGIPGCPIVWTGSFVAHGIPVNGGAGTGDVTFTATYGAGALAIAWSRFPAGPFSDSPASDGLGYPVQPGTGMAPSSRTPFSLSTLYPTGGKLDNPFAGTRITLAEA